MYQGCILCKLGTRYNTKNIQQRPKKSSICFHIAAQINQYTKAEKLEFYNNKNNSIQKPKRPSKPRRLRYKLDKEFNTRILGQQALLPYKQEVKPKGNTITQKYYTKRLLPIYVNAIQKACLQDLQNWLLQEDNNPSYRTKKEGLAQQFKRSNWVDSLVHLAQSPNLNSMEGIWNILKQRVCRCTWNSIEELKEILQDEQSKITMQEVCKHISNILGWCQLLVKTSGKPIKSVWW